MRPMTRAAPQRTRPLQGDPQALRIRPRLLGPLVFSDVPPDVPAKGGEPAAESPYDPAGADDPQDESDEPDGEDRPPRLRVPAVHRVPREEADHAESRNDGDPADERELGGSVRLQQSPHEAVELEWAQGEEGREEEQEPGDHRQPPA